MQHHVADGMSGIHCINTWSEMARGIPLKVQPFIDRTLLKAKSPPAPKYLHIEYQPPPRLVTQEIGNDGHGVANGATCMNGNGHAVNGSHVANGKSNGNHVENGKSNGNQVGNGENHDSYVEDENSNGVENGKHHRDGNGNGYGGFNGALHDNGTGIGNGNGNHSNVQSNGSKVTSGFLKSNGKSHGDSCGHGNGNSNGNSNGISIGNSNGISNGHSNGKAKEEDTAMAVRVFKFTREQLATLKRMAVEGKTDVMFSSYEMLSGHIWKCVTQARHLQASQETKLFVATDGRSRLIPPLPKGYFGNVIFTCTPIATAGELAANPVTYAARKVSTQPSTTSSSSRFKHKPHEHTKIEIHLSILCMMCCRFTTRWRE